MAATVTGVLLTGIHSARPSSGLQAGTLYSCTTHSLIYQTSDTGSTWGTWASLTGTGLTNPMTTKGDIIQGDTAGTAVRLAAGTSGYVLTAGGAGAFSAWAAAPGAFTPFALVPVAGVVHQSYGATSANWAIYIPCHAMGAMTVTGVKTAIGTSSGNICVGLYNDSGGNPNSRLATSGSVASPGTGFQNIAFTGSYAITGPGRYWLALAMDNGTVTISSSAFATGPTGGPMWAQYQTASAFPLPATAAPAGATGSYDFNLVGLVTGGWPT